MKTPVTKAQRQDMVLVLLACAAACSSAEAPASRGMPANRRTGSAGTAAIASVNATANAANPVLPASTLLPSAAGAAAAPMNTTALENCDPGSYVGTYACKLVMQGTATDTQIEGIVSFDLEINSVMSKEKCAAGQEFCDFDLVIKEGSGKLFGFVLGLIGFQTGLVGGLDCKTGKFHANAVGGVYGIPWPDPNDPQGNLKVTVELGTFDGMLDGFHSGKTPQVIAGMWDLGEPSIDIYCPGPFSVELMR